MAGKVNRFWRHTLGVIIIFITVIVCCAKKKNNKNEWCCILFACLIVGSLNRCGKKFVLGDNLMRAMEQIRNIVSGRLDINIILKWLEFT